MNSSARLFSAALLSLPFFASAQDTATTARDTGQWFSDSNPAAATDASPDQRVFAVAQEAVIPPGTDSSYTIVVTATRRALPSAWVSDDHEVINVDAIRQNSAKDVFEMIASRIPARFSDNGGGTVKTVSFMGTGSQRTLLLVDGKRMGSTEGDLGDLPSETIEKIEVIEGGQSAQYGMDAVGGVVNVITRRGASEKWSGRFSATAAAYEPSDNTPRVNSHNYQLSFGKRNGNIASFTGIDFGLSDGRYEYISSGAAFRMRHNDFRDWGVYQNLGYASGDLRLNASLGVRDRKADNPGSLLMPGDATTKKNIGFAAFGAGLRVGEHMLLKADASVSLNNIRFEMASINPSNHEYLNGDVELVQEFTFGKQMVTTGLQGIRQSVSSTELGFRVAGQGAVFASAVLSRRIGGVDVQAVPALRFDYASLFKGALNGRFGLMASLPRIQEVEPSVFANAGSSFRSPTFVDLYWPYGGGNPALKKENGFDVDGGIQLRTRSGRIDVSNRTAVFLMRLNNMIVLDDMWKPQNLDKASIAGFKFKSQVRYSEVYCAAFDFVYNNARNTPTNSVLTYRPRYVATFTNEFSARRIAAGFTLRYSSEQFVDEANTRSLPASITADVNIGVTLVGFGAGGGLRLVYDVLNITNEDRMLAEGYPLPKREHRLSLKTGF